MTEPKRWQGLDQWQALSLESYWQCFTRFNHDDKAKLLSQMVYSSEAKLAIVKAMADSSPHTAVYNVLTSRDSNTATYEQNMRYLTYIKLTSVELDDLAAQSMLDEKLSTAQIVRGLR